MREINDTAKKKRGHDKLKERSFSRNSRDDLVEISLSDANLDNLNLVIRHRGVVGRKGGGYESARVGGRSGGDI